MAPGFPGLTRQTVKCSTRSRFRWFRRDNRLAIEQTAVLEARVLVIVSGPANGQTLDDARATVMDGLMEVLPDAEKAGVVLGIEPLHPMYAAERSVV